MLIRPLQLSSRPRHSRWIVGALLLLGAPLALAAAGKVLFVAGEVRVERAAATALRAGDAVEVGDVIVTGAQSRAQLLMADGAKLALRAGTRFRIDALTLPAAVTAPGQATAVAADGSSIATLLKGGFRTTTGTIGRKDPNAYQVRTPVGVLGIRGTDYAAVFCSGDCRDAPGVRPGDAIRDGLYLGVAGGSIVFRISAGREFVLKAGEFLFIPVSGAAPESLPTAPVFILGDGAGPLEVTGTPRGPGSAPPGITDFGNRRSPANAAGPGDNGQPPADPNAPSVQRPIQGTPPQGRPVDITGGIVPPPQRRDVSFAVGVLGQAPFFSGVAENQPAQYSLDAGYNLASFTGPLPIGAANVNVAYQIGTSAVAESGGDNTTLIRWGRWAGGAAQLVNGQATQAIDLKNRSLHWVVSSDLANPPPVIPQAGQVTYTLVGGTSPTNGTSAVGTLGAATLNADFTNSTVTSTLSLDVNNRHWDATGNGAIGAQAGLPAHQFSGNYGTVNGTVGGTGQQFGGTGSFAGFFSGPGSTRTPGVPGGAALTFSLQDDLGAESVQGAAVLKAP